MSVSWGGGGKQFGVVSGSLFLAEGCLSQYQVCLKSKAKSDGASSLSGAGSD